MPLDVEEVEDIKLTLEALEGNFEFLAWVSRVEQDWIWSNALFNTETCFTGFAIFVVIIKAGKLHTCRIILKIYYKDSCYMKYHQNYWLLSPMFTRRTKIRRKELKNDTTNWNMMQRLDVALQFKVDHYDAKIYGHAKTYKFAKRRHELNFVPDVTPYI